jgi:DEAD/DEAH box helicase domain-containing protein
MLVATSNPLDQYLVRHPEYLFGAPVECGLINPNNLYVLASHVKCAAFELPFADGEEFGGDATLALLEYLAEQQILHHADGRWYWMAEAFPAHQVSLRSAAIDNFVIVDVSEPAAPRVIGEMDRLSVPTLLHEEAIYFHEAQQFQVEKLDWNEKKAFVRRVAVDYYTDAELDVHLQPLEMTSTESEDATSRSWGEVALTFRATIFKKITLEALENVGWGQIQLPEETHHTTAYWLTVPGAAQTGLTHEQHSDALVGLAHVLGRLAPLFLMCDPRDIGIKTEVRSPFTRAPTVYLYERIPGGVGLAEKLFAVDHELRSTALAHLGSCECAAGCPSCVGPTATGRSPAYNRKQAVRHLLNTMMDGLRRVG